MTKSLLYKRTVRNTRWRFIAKADVDDGVTASAELDRWLTTVDQRGRYLCAITVDGFVVDQAEGKK